MKFWVLQSVACRCRGCRWEIAGTSLDVTTNEDGRVGADC